MWRVCRSGWQKEAAADLSSHAIATLWFRFIALCRGTCTSAQERPTLHRQCSRTSLCLRYLYSTSLAVCTALARFPVHSTRTLDRARILVIASDVHFETGRKFGDAKKSIKKKPASEERKRESARASEQASVCKEPEVRQWCEEKRTNHVLALKSLNESEKRKASPICEAQSSLAHTHRTATCDDAISTSRCQNSSTLLTSYSIRNHQSTHGTSCI
jgi:hypothetical protein